MAVQTIPAVDWAWQRQSVWSQTAGKLKVSANRIWGLRLGLTVAAAAGALGASQIKGTSVTGSVTLGVLAAVAMATVGVLRARQDVERTRRWARARSVSEAIKTEVYTFLAEPDAGAGATEQLEAEIQRLEHETGDLVRYTEGVQAKERSLPAVHDLDSYLEVRVRRLQLEGYYQPKARQLRRRLRWIKGIEVTLALAAGGLAAVAAVAPTVAAWAAVATTASGAVAAYVAAQRYEFLWIEYSRTAGELRRLVERRTAPNGRALTDRQLIDECEQVISVQNQAWMAKWGEENDTAAVGRA